MLPVDASDVVNEEVCADAADVGDEEAAVGDRVDVRHHVVAQMFVPVTPLAAADKIKHSISCRHHNEFSASVMFRRLKPQAFREARPYKWEELSAPSTPVSKKKGGVAAPQTPGEHR